MTIPNRPKQSTVLRGAAIVASMGAIAAAIPLVQSVLMDSGRGAFSLLFCGLVPQLIGSWSAPRVMVYEPGFPGWPYAWWLVPVAFLVIGTCAALLLRYKPTVEGDLSILFPVVVGWHLLWITRLADLASPIVNTLMFDSHPPGPADEMMLVPVVIQLSLHVASVAAIAAISLRHRESDRLRSRVVILSIWVFWIFSLGFPPVL